METSKSPVRTMPGRAAKNKRNYDYDSFIDEDDDFRSYKQKKTKKEIPDLGDVKESFEKLCNYINQKNKQEAGTNKNSDEDIIVVEDEKKEIKINQLYWSVESVLTNLLRQGEDPNRIKIETVCDRLKVSVGCSLVEVLTDVKAVAEKVLCHVDAEEKPTVQIKNNITNKDLETLEKTNWLNDVIINHYMELLCCEAEEIGFSYKAISSFLLEHITNESKRKDKKKHVLPSDWLEFDHLLIPIYYEDHWFLLLVNILSRTANVFNSFETSKREKKQVKIILDYMDKHSDNNDDDRVNWTVNYNHKHKQDNTYDCGVYVCMFARSIIFKIKQDIEKQHVTSYREWMKNEIIEGKLLR